MRGQITFLLIYRQYTTSNQTKFKSTLYYMSNGGFPPIKYIEEIKDEKKETLKKDRLYAPVVKKNVDIKHILSLAVKKQMINVDINRIDVIQSF
jgi:hypothetical protein